MAEYGYYFLGSIIIGDKDSQKFGKRSITLHTPESTACNLKFQATQSSKKPTWMLGKHFIRNSRRRFGVRTGSHRKGNHE